jgi:excinuclease ABC subunit A
MDVIRCADHIIDIGPEGGSRGGELVAEGTPASIMKNPKSITGEYLKREIEAMKAAKRNK